MEIQAYSEKYKSQTIHLILSILEGEFGLTGIKRPDLENIPGIYQNNNGNFWIAIEKGKVIGTIALRNYGSGRGYLKRMYVDKEFRGKGLSNELFSTLVQFAKDNKYKEIFLATVEDLIAANRFYKKIGFKRIDALPNDMQSFGDTIFYKFDLVE